MSNVEFGYRTSERECRSGNSRRSKKVSKTKKNHFAYIQKEEIDRWFSTFIAEVCRVDGDQYPPRNIHKLLSGILRYMRYYSCDTPNVLYRRDSRFKPIRGACKVVFRELCKAIGTSVRHVGVIKMEEEDQLLLKTIVLFIYITMLLKKHY